MKSPVTLRLIVLSSLAVAALLALAVLLFVRRTPPVVRIASGSKGSSTLELGVALAEVVRREVTDSAPVALETPGGVYNADIVHRGEAELGLVPNNASGGSRVRTLAMLEEEVMHIVVRAGEERKDLSALRGKRVAVGPEGSGTERLARQLLAHFHIREREMTPIHLAHMDAANAFVEGKIDAVFCLTGLLAPAVERMLTAPDARLLAFGSLEDPGSTLSGIRLSVPFVSATTIPANTYGAQPESAVGAVGVSLLLVANEDFSEQRAYAVTRAVFENRVQIIDRERGRFRLRARPDEDDLRFPVHSGAKRYYERDEPPLILAWADTMSLGLTIVLLLYSSIAAWRTQQAHKQKQRVDKFYSRLQTVSERMLHTEAEEELSRLLSDLHEIRRSAFADLMTGKLEANESFTIFQDYLRSELAEVEGALRDLRAWRREGGKAVAPMAARMNPPESQKRCCGEHASMPEPTARRVAPGPALPTVRSAHVAEHAVRSPPSAPCPGHLTSGLPEP